MVDQTETQIRFKKTYRTGLVWLGTVLLFPFGLLLYIFLKREAIVIVTLTPEGDGTSVTIAGQAEGKLRKGLLELADGAGSVAGPN